MRSVTKDNRIGHAVSRFSFGVSIFDPCASASLRHKQLSFSASSGGIASREIHRSFSHLHYKRRDFQEMFHTLQSLQRANSGAEAVGERVAQITIVSDREYWQNGRA